MLSLLKDIFDLRKNLKSSEDEIRSIQTERFQRQINYVASCIPFYKEYFDKNKLKPSDFHSLQDISKLPVIGKDVVRGKEEWFQNSTMRQRPVYSSQTSGSTGRKFTSYFDKRTWFRKKYLSKLRARLYTGAHPWNRAVVLNSDPPDEQYEKNKKLFGRWPFRRIRYISLLENPELVLEELIAFRPSILYGPPSFLYQLSDRIIKQNTDFDFIRYIYTSAEYLSNPMREKIKLGFGKDILDVFGSSEFKEIAWECGERNGYHINEDELIVEILDNNNRVLQEGEIGHVVVSDLFNKAMPLLRYNLNDVGVLFYHRCPCGCSFRLMSPRGGRATDFVMFDRENLISPYVFEDAVELVNGIWQYQVIQESMDLLRVVVVTDFEKEVIAAEVKKVISPLIPDHVQVDVSFAESIDLEENGKFKLVKRNFK